MASEKVPQAPLEKLHSTEVAERGAEDKPQAGVFPEGARVSTRGRRTKEGGAPCQSSFQGLFFLNLHPLPPPGKNTDTPNALLLVSLSQGGGGEENRRRKWGKRNKTHRK
jgi:hypothetical protein